MRLSELVIVGRVEGPRHTSAQQGLNYLGLQQTDRQAEPGGPHIAYQPLAACPHDWDPSLDIKHEVSVFVDNAAEA